MNDFLKMDVFFFVTTVAVIALGIVLLFIGIRIMRILGHVERILEMAEQETDLIREDIAQLRSEIRRKGFGMLSMGRFVSKVASRFTKESRKAK